jgi:ABC-type transport system substrate-binding protein/class 3 adenylate cyclase
VSVELTIGSTLAGFRIERLIGRGSMGAVYLTEDNHLRRKVAVKVLAPELVEDERFRHRFLLESQLAASLEHPHIVPIYGAGEADENLFLAMKYIEGYDLRELLEATEQIDAERALRLLAQTADALDVAHGLGLVHRDVKPANVLIGGAGDDEHAYLCDFGLARHASTIASLTGHGGFVGTIAYVAPEQIESGAVDARADVYSLACVLFECLTGAAPFDRDGDLQVVFAHLKESPPLVTSFRPDLPDVLDGVLQRGLAKAPDDRFSTCTELVASASEALKVETPVVSGSTRRTIAGVRTFLIADVRGYTSYTQEHGDEAAAALASQFADVVDKTVEERDGRLIELRGDEALVVFDSTRQALRAAVELQERFAAAGLARGVGIGLDAGEAVPVGEGYRGGALNLAARLCSLAGPGEVLASETVLQLASAVDGIRYGERRSERVKGLSRPVTLFEVLPEGRRVGRWSLARTKRRAKRLAGHRGVQLVAAALVIIAAVAGGLLLTTGGHASAARIPPNSVGILSPSGRVEGSILVGGPGTVVKGAGGYWAVNWDDQTIGKLDLRAHKLLKPLISIGFVPGGVAAGQRYLWVADLNSPTLLRIDPRFGNDGKKQIRVRGADQAAIDTTADHGIAECFGSVWYAISNKLFRLDPETGAPKGDPLQLPNGTEIDCANGSVWVTSAPFGTISKVNPALGEIVRKLKFRSWLGSTAIGGGFVWGGVIPDDTLWKADLNGNVIKTFNLGHGLGGAAFSGGYLWVPIVEEGRIARIDPSSDEVRSFPIADRPVVAAPGPGGVLVNTEKGPRKLTPLPADQAATFVLAEAYVDDTDPATAFIQTPYRAQVMYATGAQLLNYPDAAAPAGTHLRPEVAAAMPTISDGGRTYTFRIRPGYRFSPPSNAPVTAETFKSTLERALSPGLGDGAVATSYLTDIVGANEFHDGKASHVKGITARGNTLTIRLEQPAGDFLARLSLPNFQAVPIGTPIVKGGVQHPIPSAGPYYIWERFGTERLVLEENPNYRGPRPHRLKRIVYDLNNSTRRLLSLINSGRADYTADVEGVSEFARNGTLDTRYGARAGADQRFYLVPISGFNAIQFNTREGPLRAARLRRAISYAIDRRRIASVSGGIPNGQYFTAAMPGYRRHAVYPLTPDVARARALAGPVGRPLILFTCNTAQCTEQASYLKADLAKVGIRVKSRKFDDQYAAVAEPGAKWDMLATGWVFDVPDPSNFFDVLVADVGYRPYWSPEPALADPAVDARLSRLAAMPPPRRYPAASREEANLLRTNPPFAAYENQVQPQFFSERVGCKVFQAVYIAVDIGAMCIR